MYLYLKRLNCATPDCQRSFALGQQRRKQKKSLMNSMKTRCKLRFQVELVRFVFCNNLGKLIRHSSDNPFRVPRSFSQRLRTCQEYIGREGIAEQSSIIDTPKFHKRYVLPGKNPFLFAQRMSNSGILSEFMSSVS